MRAVLAIYRRSEPPDFIPSVERAVWAIVRSREGKPGEWRPFGMPASAWSAVCDYFRHREAVESAAVRACWNAGRVATKVAPYQPKAGEAQFSRDLDDVQSGLVNR
jgi:hypothetical protein